MFAVLLCITQAHDLRLVVVAALICAVSCTAAFGFYRRSLRGVGLGRWTSSALTGFVAGAGVWATHFTAELAYQPTLAIAYEAWATIASLFVAILGMGLGFACAVKNPTRAGVLTGGGFTGFSIAAMHFTGMAAVRTQAHILWDWRYVAASVAIAILGGMAAFEGASRLKGRLGWVAPPVLMVLAIVGLHFTAMTAVILRPDPMLAIPHEVIGRGPLAVMTVGLASLIFAAAAGLILTERLSRRSTLTSLRQALDVVPAGLVFYDANDRTVAWNEAYASLMEGCGVTTAAGMSREVFIEAAHAAGWFDTDEAGPAGRMAEIKARRSGSSEMNLPGGRWLRHESFRTADGGGVTVFTDVTEQKETARVMADARDAAEAANRAKSEFLANMSHEIRTPLNGVLSVADLLTRTRLSARQRELVGVIRQSGSMLNALLADLLDLARVEAGATELRPEPTAMGELIGSIRDLFAGSAEAKGLMLRVELGDGAETAVECDPVRLRQVLGNLVSNAVKFTEAGEVVLSVTRTGKALRFEVRDTGPGFEESQKAALLQRFGQGDTTTTRKHGGAGLGLAICDEYVRLMGGELEARSAPGAGAVFGFTLQAPALSPAPVEAAAAAEVFPEAGGYRVLVVDDNATNRQVLQMILESAGIDCHAAEDGAQGLEAMRSGSFDAVLMDIQMPVMDGFEATRRIRAWEAEAGRPRAPIYIVSANCLKEHVEAGRTAGADGHLNKPISVAELLDTLMPHVAAGRLAA